MDPISTARYGLIAASRNFDAAATAVSNQAVNGDMGDPKPVVDMLQAKQAFKASVGVVKIADQMWQSLLDIQAEPKTA